MQQAQNATSLARKNDLKERYEKISLLGEGSFGRVYKAIDKIHNTEVAMKKLKAAHSNDGLMCSTLREISVLKKLNNPNIMSLYDIVYLPEDNQLYLILELMTCDLKKLIKTNKTLSPCIYASIIAQILSGVRYCHERRIIHRDLKPENILVDESNFLVKITDFGLAKPFCIPGRPMSLEIQTLYYKAPETLLGETKYCFGVDIWSIGCIFVEMLTGKILFQGDSEIGQIFKIFSVFGNPADTTNICDWPEVKNLPEFKQSFPNFKKSGLRGLLQHCSDLLLIDLLEKMLQVNPKNRYSADDCLHHPFFKQYDISVLTT